MNIGSVTFSNITHGGSTKISSHTGKLWGISNQKYLILGLFCCEFIHNRVMTGFWFSFIKFLACFGFWLKLPILALIFSLWGWAGFLVLGGLVIECVLPQKPHIYTISLFWPHLPVSQSLPDWGVCASSLVCLCHGSVYCASMPEVCQHARGSSQKCLSFPGHTRGPRYPESPRHCPTVPDGSKLTRLYLWCNVYLKWWYCIVLPLMWQPFGCGYCQSVWQILTNTKFSLFDSFN